MTDRNKLVAELIRGLKHERDELKLQMHLAKKEIQDELSQLDDKLDSLDRRYTPLKHAVGESSTEVWDSLKLVGQEIREGFKKVRDAL